MAFRDTTLGALVRRAPAQAAERICAALAACDGSIPLAAKRLRCAAPSLKRWVRSLTDAGYTMGPLRPKGARSLEPNPQAKIRRKPALEKKSLQAGST